MQTKISRRRALRTAALTACVGTSLTLPKVTKAADPQSSRLRYGLNTSTLRGHKIPFVEKVDIIAKAGYDGFEPWVGEIQDYQKSGGNLKDLRKRIEDHGLTVDGAISFPGWIVDDEAKRKQGLENARRDMDILRQIGGTHIAAPPAGATRQSDLNLFAAAERYRALLEVGDEMGVIPVLEVWGFSQSLSRLGEVAMVAVESGHPKACILPDVYHIYKGGSDFNGLKLINGKAIPAMHMNDYPAEPTREKIGDGDRVYPGDGVAPMNQILRDLRDAGFSGVLSLELFNRTYWEQDPLEVAKTGLAKMKASVAKALG